MFAATTVDFAATGVLLATTLSLFADMLQILGGTKAISYTTEPKFFTTEPLLYNYKRFYRGNNLNVLPTERAIFSRRNFAPRDYQPIPPTTAVVPRQKWSRIICRGTAEPGHPPQHRVWHTGAGRGAPDHQPAPCGAADSPTSPTC